MLKVIFAIIVTFVLLITLSALSVGTGDGMIYPDPDYPKPPYPDQEDKEEGEE